MANVLSRTPPYQYLRSVNDPDYDVADWIFNPDMSATVGFAPRYWTVTGDIVSVVDQAARDAIDAAALEARKDSIADELDATQTIMRAFAETVLDELNAHADKINGILDAIDAANNLADVKAAIGAISDYPQRSLAQLKTTVRGKL